MGIGTFLIAFATLVSIAFGNVTPRKVYNVAVSNRVGALEFVPKQIMANPGDQIHFQFWPKCHYVTQSSFANPCTKLTNGFDTGFVPVLASQRVPTKIPYKVFEVTDTKPRWFYCRQANYCSKGMVFAVNPTNAYFDKFQSKAIDQAGISAKNVSSNISVRPKVCSPRDIAKSALLDEEGPVNGIFTCKYSYAGTCQYQDGRLHSGSKYCPPQTSGPSDVTGELGDDDDDIQPIDFSTLLRNSWIIIGLLASVFLLSVSFVTAILVRRRRQRRDFAYSKVSMPKVIQDEEKPMTSKQYSDI
ncbi:hypothetical protein QCA50_005136 [Cerrena zonata]|uniref:Uncharacterized protein n=1 Tax=Cerrena zonata TaxID=2478898 RepID=A0AAW0GG47_9APHY